MKKIWMVGAWANNYGDRILQKANADLLSRISDCCFAYINCQQTYFSRQLIDYLNKDADMLFLAGGGLIFNRPQDKSFSGWQWNIKKEDIGHIKVPIVVNAVGYNKFPGDASDFKSGMWDHVQETIDRSVLFSVRNTGTYERLNCAGLNTSGVEITPDCGMFIKEEPFEHDIFSRGFKIGLNWATDRIQQRFGENWTQKLLDVLTWCKEMIKEKQATVYLIEHLMPNELNYTAKKIAREMFASELGKNGIIVRDELETEMYPMFDYTASFFANIYGKMDLVVGMRGHSMIVPFGLGVPIIGLGQHNKIKWFLEDVGLEDFLVRLDCDSNKNVAGLGRLTDRIFDDLDSYMCTIKHSRENQTNQCTKWFDKIRNILEHSHG